VDSANGQSPGGADFQMKGSNFRMSGFGCPRIERGTTRMARIKIPEAFILVGIGFYLLLWRGG
jgi:hypothetical protein